MNTLSSVSHRRINSKQAIPSRPQATASPSMVQDCGLSLAGASTIRGAPVGLVAEQPIMLVAAQDFPANTLPEFIASVKTNNAKI